MKNKQILIQAKTFNEARKKIREIRNFQKENEIIFSGSDDKLNRKVLEKEDIDVLLINLKDRKDFMKQRNSGFNHVLAKIAKKQKTNIGINLDEIIKTKGKDKSDILGRVIQNIRICNKKKLNMEFLSIKGYERDERELKSLGSVLGMPTRMIK